MQFTLGGLHPLEPSEPICHMSFYEADEYARWSGTRLATEPKWETASVQLPIKGNFVEGIRFHVSSAGCESEIRQPFW